MRNNTHLSLSQDGFTLIEAMIALVVFLVVALGLASGELTALYVQRGNDYRNEALRIAEDEMTRLKGERFSLSGVSAALAPVAWTALPDFTANIRSGTTTFVRRVQVTDLATSGLPMKRIDVAVGWTQGTSGNLLAPTNRNKQAVLSTIITRSN